MKLFCMTIVIAILWLFKIAIPNITCLTYYKSVEKLDSSIFVPKKQEFSSNQTSSQSISLPKRNNNNFRRQVNNFAIINSVELDLQFFDKIESLILNNCLGLNNCFLESNLAIRAGPVQLFFS